MTQGKLNLNDLRKIVKEELVALQEQVDHSGIRDVVNNASKLLAAVEAFRDNAAPTMISSVTPQLDQLASILEDMVSTPGSYVMKPKVEPKKVSLRVVNSESKKRNR
jgi:hypothetical protein